MGNMFVVVVEGLHTALRIFVILKTFNTTNSMNDPAIFSGIIHFCRCPPLVYNCELV
jgi:hypothetical protein